MPRIEFDGKGDPIPSLALPPFGGDDAIPPTALTFTENADFSVAEYVALGFTHYEAICIGAAGGDGGLVPHSRNYSYGGAGGGGGMHKASGLLADLPAVVPVAVGLPGAHGGNGNGQDTYLLATSYGLHNEDSPDENLAIVDTGDRPLTRGGNTYIRADGSYVAPWTLVNTLGVPVPSDYSGIDKVFYIVRPNTIVSPWGDPYIPPQDGSDGEYSAFGAVCMASGGKGGKKSPIYTVYNHYWEGIQDRPGGDGGDGGVGGRTAVGGGGKGAVTAGSPLTLTPAEDGTWDGTIGKGGGGGRGGTLRLVDKEFGAGMTEKLYAGSNGGQGSFNYGDTSVYGPRQLASLDPTHNRLIVPGEGGGARLRKASIFGSRTPGANPGGVVSIRLVRIV